MEELLRAQWQAAVGHGSGGGTSRADDHLERLLARYREPQRRYHTVTHLAAVLGAAEELMGQVEVTDPEAVRLALFFHDAVYDPRSATNEADSAALARAVLSELEVPAARVDTVVSLIMATQHQTPPPSDSRRLPPIADPDGNDTAVVLDADLAILAAEPSRYQAYATRGPGRVRPRRRRVLAGRPGLGAARLPGSSRDLPDRAHAATGAPGSSEPGGGAGRLAVTAR